MIEVPFVDFKRMHAPIKEEIDYVINKIIEKGAFVGGQYLEEFEENFARYIGVRNAIGVSSGTAALEIILRALKIGPGDEVIIPANTFIATAFAVSAVGAKLVLCDVGAIGYNMNMELVEDLITDKTKAIIPVHLYGNMANVLGLETIADKYDNIAIVEDCCQAIGASLGKKAGNWLG